MSIENRDLFKTSDLPEEMIKIADAQETLKYSIATELLWLQESLDPDKANFSLEDLDGPAWYEYDGSPFDFVQQYSYRKISREVRFFKLLDVYIYIQLILNFFLHTKKIFW